MAWQQTEVREFLFPREERYKANDPAIAGMPRIEKIDFSGNVVLSQKPSKTDMIVIHPGDFVISGINVAKGAMAVYQGSEPVTATIHYSSYTVNKAVIELQYLKRFLKSPVFVQLLKEQVPGGIKTEIKPKHMLPLVIDLPELPEQKTILERFYNTEDEYSHLVGEIETQKKLLAKYRQAVLQEAIEGKLTADWREDNPDVEPASELLDRISKEKADLVKHKIIRKLELLTEITEKEIPFDIPDTWQWCRLQRLVDEQRGITYGIVKMGKEPSSGGIPALRCSDVRPRRLDLTHVRTVTSKIDQEYSRTKLKGREVLLNVRGTLGGCAVVPYDIAGFNIAREVSLIPLHDDAHAEYIVNLLASPFFIAQVNANLKGIAYKGLNLNLLRNFMIPLPPLKEQEEIVRCVEAKFALCDVLESEIQQAEQHVQTLSAAILQEFFGHAEGAE